jgi:catechol 2,3-dioxygenase-like lactoylglutathione lyase family enzyme
MLRIPQGQSPGKRTIRNEATASPLAASPLARPLARAWGRLGAIMDYRLAFVRVFVTDWDRALRFYAHTLGMPVMFRSDELGWAQLGTDGPPGPGGARGAQLALERVQAGYEAPVPGSEEPLVGRFVGVSLEVPDVYETYKMLSERGVSFVSAPERQPWGGVLAHFSDPDGNVLTLFGASREV